MKNMQNAVSEKVKMSHDDILEYAKSRGLKNVSLTHHPTFGWELSGDGTARNGWPLVWKICSDLGMG